MFPERADVQEHGCPIIVLGLGLFNGNPRHGRIGQTFLVVNVRRVVRRRGRGALDQRDHDPDQENRFQDRGICDMEEAQNTADSNQNDNPECSCEKEGGFLSLVKQTGCGYPKSVD